MPYCVLLYCTELHGTVLYCAVLHYILLWCTVLFCDVHMPSICKIQFLISIRQIKSPLKPSYEFRKLNRSRNRSLPANLAKPDRNDKQQSAMDYLQVPTKISTPSFTYHGGNISRRVSTSSLSSKSSLSSFGIYSAPDTPMVRLKLAFHSRKIAVF